MLVWDYNFPILDYGDQILLLFFILICYFLVIFNLKNKISKIKHIFIFFGFLYAFFLINFTFLPLNSANLENIFEKINLIPFSTFSSKNHIFYSFLLAFPSGIFVSYFLRNFKKEIIFWVSFSIIFELLQLLNLYFLANFWFWNNRPFSIDDIILRFLWFLFWVFIFRIFSKILQKK